MPPTYWCPRCWDEVSPEAVRCPICGYDLATYAALPFEGKLLLSLRHPVLENRMLAAQILGRRRVRIAVPALRRLLDEETDFYLLRAALNALAQIGTDESRAAIKETTAHPSALIRDVAQRLCASRHTAPENPDYSAEEPHD